MSEASAEESLGRILEIAPSDRGNAQLGRWLSREIDAEGAPRRIQVEDWLACARLLERSRCAQGLSGDAAERASTFLAAANGWAPKRRTGQTHVGWGSTRLVMARLQEGQGAIRVVGHDPGEPCGFELLVNDHAWLGPCWSVEGDELASKQRLLVWDPEKAYEQLEWVVAAGDRKLVRSVVVLRGLKLALVSALVECPAGGSASECAMTLALPAGVTAAPQGESRALELRSGSRSKPLQVLPLGLPFKDYPTERGRLVAAPGSIVLRQAAPARRTWMPLLISWDESRRKRSLSWRNLTVTEKGRILGPDQATAVRVSWGRDETYLIYRSHARSGLRAALGHCTTRRFLVGRFQRDGAIKPILEAD